MQVVLEFLMQTVKLIFFLALIVLAVKFGIYFRKKKNLKDNSNEK